MNKKTGGRKESYCTYPAAEVFFLQALVGETIHRVDLHFTEAGWRQVKLTSANE
jgi:hypothetical protein